MKSNDAVHYHHVFPTMLLPLYRVLDESRKRRYPACREACWCMSASASSASCKQRVAYTQAVICGVGLLTVLSEDSREYVQRVCMCINFASQPPLPLNISSFGKHFVLRRPVRIQPISLRKCGTVQVPDPRSFPRTWSTYF